MWPCSQNKTSDQFISVVVYVELHDWLHNTMIHTKLDHYLSSVFTADTDNKLPNSHAFLYFCSFLPDFSCKSTSCKGAGISKEFVLKERVSKALAQVSAIKLHTNCPQNHLRRTQSMDPKISQLNELCNRIVFILYKKLINAFWLNSKILLRSLKLSSTHV